MTGQDEVAARIEALHREEFGRIVAALAHRFGDLGLAEEVTQDAFAEAVRRWPADGLPPHPPGWLATTARHRALDRVRRESTRQARHQEAQMLREPGPDDPAHPSLAPSSVPDERLRLLFTCCHPALAPATRVALTLRLLGGLSVPEIAAAFLVEERTMAQRITRAKQKIAAARIPYRVPPDHELPDRLRPVLATLYLVFNEGYLPRSGDQPVRTDLCAEAIRLTRVLRLLMPDEPEVAGLLALMLLTEARRPARVVDGRLVPLDEQDRRAWDRALVAEGHALVRECLHRNRPGHHQLLAAINAVHTDAPSHEETDWAQLLALYEQLHAVTPTPVVALNRALVVAELAGPAAGLDLVEELGGALASYQPFHVARADLLRRLGETEQARVAYESAVAMTANGAERTFLLGRVPPPERLGDAGLRVRTEEPGDAEAVDGVVAAAFREAPHSAPPRTPGGPPGEVDLLQMLRADPGWLPALSLVAERGGRVVGHVVCTRADVDGAPALGLGPVSVLPGHQREGVGTALVRAVLARAEEAGETLVALLGDSAYYRRFGFAPASGLGLEAPEEEWGDHFQALALGPSPGSGPRGRFRYAAPFDAF